MTLSLDLDTIHLSGECRVEDAEQLLILLQSGPRRSVDIAGVSHLHAAIVQILLTFRPSLTGTAANPFVARWLTPFFVAASDTGPFAT